MPQTAVCGCHDDRLVTLIDGGDSLAFECLVGRYTAPLTGYARLLLGGSHHDAEEVVQDVFVRARDGLMSDPARAIVMRPWLFAIARNACLNRLRKPLRTVWLEDHEARLAAPGADPAERFARGEALRLIVNDLQRLPLRQRDALVKLALEGRTHAQVAAELGVSIAASKALVHRARAAMTTLRAEA